MQLRLLGRTGLAVSRLGLGTMTWGRDTDIHEARDQLRAFVEAGGTLLDTGSRYGSGAAEEVLGDLVSGPQPVVERDQLVIATKAGTGISPGGLGADASRRRLLADLDGSLRRLGVDAVDLWQVQAWSEAPLEETLSAVDLAVGSGRARYAGVCNYSGWQTAAAATYQRAWPGRAPIVSTQVEYSLLERGVEREVLPAAGGLGLGVLAWSPLGRGVLTGKYRLGTPADSRAASPHFEAFVGRYLDGRSRRIVDAVSKAADGLGLAPLEVALAWVRDRPGVTAPVVGARTAAQLRGSLAAEDVELPAEISAVLEEVSAPELGYPERA